MVKNLKKYIILLALYSSASIACEVAVYYQKPEGCEKRAEIKQDGLDEHEVIEIIKQKAFKEFANTIHILKTEKHEVTVHGKEGPVGHVYEIKANGYFCESP